MHIFIGALVARHRNRGCVRALTAAQPSQFFWWTQNSIVRSCDVVSVSTFWSIAHYPPKLCTNIKYLKIHRALRNEKYMLRLPNCASNMPFARSDPHRSIIHIHTPFVNILGGSDVRYEPCKLLEAISMTQNQSEYSSTTADRTLSPTDTTEYQTSISRDTA